MAPRKAAAAAKESMSKATTTVTKPAAKATKATSAAKKAATKTTTKSAASANTKVKRGRPAKAKETEASETEAPYSAEEPKKKVNATNTKAKAPAKPSTTKAASTKTTKATKATAKSTTTRKAPGRPKEADTEAAATDGEKPAPKSRKRKAESEEVQAPAAKKLKKDEVINEAPKDVLNVYVFGEGSSGELGLGNARNAVDVKRPRLNPNLAADKVGVVKVACGGMHAVALTKDNKILTWGVNDQGALGRSTAGGEVLKDMKEGDDSDSDSESDEGSGLNPLESFPAQIDMENIPEGTVFTDVAAGDSITLAITDDGRVYGCGTFRSNEGIMGFGATSGENTFETKMALIPELRHIKQVACGANHILALDNKGAVYAWGSGQQNQLGRRITERTKQTALKPYRLGFRGSKKIEMIGCGEYHSFAVDDKQRVFAWGSNPFGETAIRDNAGADNAAIAIPTIVPALSGKNIKQIEGGSHHSIAILENGDALFWGRCDGGQSGMDASKVPFEHLITDKMVLGEEATAEDPGKPKVIAVPTKINTIPEPASVVACGLDHNVVVTKAGKAYSWGFGVNYQTGLGTDEDVYTATLIDNTAVRDKKLVWSGCGGQYSMLASVADVEFVPQAPKPKEQEEKKEDKEADGEKEGEKNDATLTNGV